MAPINAADDVKGMSTEGAFIYYIYYEKLSGTLNMAPINAEDYVKGRALREHSYIMYSMKSFPGD